MEELVSVIVPVYNVEKYIDRCVNSIINQTYKTIEIILVDDGSTDSCSKICDKYANEDTRIKVIHKENGGLSDARNEGIKIATGKYITLIDSDDYVEPDYVELLYNLLIENDADMSVCKHFVVYENAGTIDTGTGNFYNLSPKEALEMLLYGNDFDLGACEKLYKKELFENIKYPKGRLFEDAATTYKLIDLCKKISFKSEAKYTYYIRSNSITTNSFNSKKMDLIISTKEMSDYIKNKYPDLEKAANRRLMYAYLSTLTQIAKSKKSEESVKYSKQIMEYIKTNRKDILKDKKIPKRDRVALYSTIFGYNFFKISWNLYEKITKRK